MKKILSIILSAVIITITNVWNADAQDNVAGLL